MLLLKVKRYTLHIQRFLPVVAPYIISGFIIFNNYSS